MATPLVAHVASIAPKAVLSRTCHTPQRANLTSKPSLQAKAFQRFHRRSRVTTAQRGRLQICMVRTESVDLALGTKAPAFQLPEPLTGNTVSLTDFNGSKALLVLFICNHCPFVVHLKPAIVELAKEYQGKGVGVVAISSNSVQTHPKDGPDKMAQDAKDQGYTFPYLYDESQEVAKAYKAACTPEFYIFDSEFALQYHGQFDDSRPSNGVPVTGADLREALDTVLSGKPITTPIKPSLGCNVKWRPGNEPDYFKN